MKIGVTSVATGRVTRLCAAHRKIVPASPVKGCSVFRASSKGLRDLSPSLPDFLIITDCGRYPTDIDFDPQLKKWKCPFCRDTCNCTKCCFKRHVRYTSTANVKIDQDTLLHYADLMPNNSNPTKRLPPPQKPSKSDRGSKKSNLRPTREFVKAKSTVENVPPPSKPPARRRPKEEIIQTAALNSATTPDIESIIRGLADTAAMFEKFGCGAGEYWGVVFSHIDGGRIGVAYVGDKLPDIFFLKDGDDGDRTDEPPPAKRLRVSSGAAA